MDLNSKLAHISASTCFSFSCDLKRNERKKKIPFCMGAFDLLKRLNICIVHEE
jgi:hypothetical protein